MKPNSNHSLTVDLLGCSNQPAIILYSAYKVATSDDDPAVLWEQLQNKQFSRKIITDELGEEVFSLDSLPQTQFVFIAQGISFKCSSILKKYKFQLNPIQFHVQADEEGANFVTPPGFYKNEHVLEKWLDLQERLNEFYTLCERQGIRKADVIYAHVVGTAYREQLTMGFHAMQQFIDEAMCDQADWELKELATRIYRKMKQEFPSLSERLGIKCWENRSMFCTESLEAYQQCPWKSSRPHKNKIKKMWNAPRSDSLRLIS